MFVARLDLGAVKHRRGAARSDGGSRRHDVETECDGVSRRHDAEDAVEECDWMSRRLDAENEELSSWRLKDAEFTEVEGTRSSRK